MPEVTVRQYADVIGVSVDRLLEQLQQAGLSEKSADDAISENEKAEKDLVGELTKKGMTFITEKDGLKTDVFRKRVLEQVKIDFPDWPPYTPAMDFCRVN